MNDQKIENLLNASLSVTSDERAKSVNLETGYNPSTRIWEIIVMYSSTKEAFAGVLAGYDNLSVIWLLGRFAIINTIQENIELLAGEPLVEFIEKPKRLYFEDAAGNTASCISAIQADNSINLRGKGVITGIIDTGIDYAAPAFRNSDGSTRILSIWDQTAVSSVGKVPDYGFGTEYSEDDINNSLNLSGTAGSSDSTFSVTDVSGHGTAVARIAAGNDGVAPESSIIFVKMGLAREDSFPRTTQLMCAIDYIIRKAVSYLMPVAINISFGSNYGDHTGTSLIETYINSVSYAWKNSICIGTGNEADAATHTSGILKTRPENVDLAISAYERNLNMQIWKQYWDRISISILSPAGRLFDLPDVTDSVIRIHTDNTTLLIYNGLPSPFAIMQEIYFDFIPDSEYIGSGIWRFILTPQKIISGEYNIWLPASAALNNATGFLAPNSEKTFTIPSTASRAISVGAYNSSNNSYAAFSGRGYSLTGAGFVLAKPDICAPGVSINAGGRTFTGTSFATPFVTGSAAIMMEWGIVRGNDPFLYGEKLKAYLINGAKPLPGYKEVPNAATGWGALCTRSSLPL